MYSDCFSNRPSIDGWRLAVAMDESFSDDELIVIPLLLDEDESQKYKKKNKKWIHSILKKRKLEIDMSLDIVQRFTKIWWRVLSVF